MKYFHFHDWTGEELAAAACIPPRQMEIRDSARVGHEEGGGGHEGKRKARSSGRAVREREIVSLSLCFSPCGSHRMGGRRVLGTRRVSIKWL